MNKNSKVSRLAIQSICEMRGIQFEQPQRSEDELFGRFYNFLKIILETAQSIQKHQYDTKLSVEHFNEALTLKSLKPLLGYAPNRKIQYETAGYLDNTKIECPVDRQLDLQEVVNQQLLNYPKETFYSFHWLSVLKGVQPRLPQNEKYVFDFLFILWNIEMIISMCININQLLFFSK